MKLKWRKAIGLFAAVALLSLSVPAVISAANGQGFGQAGASMKTAGGMLGGPMTADVESLLGISREDLMAERSAGKSLVQIAEEKGISKDRLTSLMLQQHTERVDAMVAAGQLDQTQAEQMKAQMQERVQAMIERTETGKPAWAGKGNGNGLGKGQGHPGAGACRSAGTAN